MKETATMTTGIELIAAERARQVEVEGYTPDHDDAHTDGAIAVAAATYALPEERRATGRQGEPKLWPWGWEHWKPSPDACTRVQELAKAGALIAAEMDRLIRLGKAPTAWLDRVRAAHSAACTKTDDGKASPVDVAKELQARGWLALESTLDVADALKELATAGLLSGPAR